MPGIVAGSEWRDYYTAMAEEFGIQIDSTGPNFGVEHLLDTITDSATLATFVGSRTRVAWPARVRRIPIRHPTPVYPWSLAWHTVNHHPALDKLRDYLRHVPTPPSETDTWSPGERGVTQTEARTARS